MLVRQSVSKKCVMSVCHVDAMLLMHNVTTEQEPYHKWVVGHSQDVTLVPDALNHVLAYQVIFAHHLQGAKKMHAQCSVS